MIRLNILNLLEAKAIIIIVSSNSIQDQLRFG